MYYYLYGNQLLGTFCREVYYNIMSYRWSTMGTFTVKHLWYNYNVVEVYKKNNNPKCLNAPFFYIFYFCLECCISSLQITNCSLSRHVELTSGTSVYPHIDAL